MLSAVSSVRLGRRVLLARNVYVSDHIHAEARVLHAGQSTAFCESEARDDTGKILAKAIGTFKLLGEKK